MISEPATAGILLRRTFELLRICSAKSLLALALLTAIGVADEMLMPGGASLTIASAIASLLLQYEITYSLLSELGLMQPGYRARRFLAILGLGLLSGIAIILGLLFLIVPGILLLVRWYVAVPVLIGEEAGVVESLERSWQQTAGRFLPILGTVVAIYLPMIAMMGIAVGAYDETAAMGWTIAVMINLVATACTVVGWHAAVAIYVDGRDEPRLSEVFA